MAIVSGVSVDPMDAEGNLKTAEDCFWEAYRIASGLNESEDSDPAPIKTAEDQKGAWNDTDTVASWYVTKLVKTYDKDWLEWEPETTWQTVERKFKTILSALAKNKINAVKNILLTDAFWEDWNVFEKTVSVFNDYVPNFFSIEPPSPAEMAWAVSEANFIRPGEEFSEEVSEYARRICSDAGLVYFPGSLKFAQAEPLSQLAADIKSAWGMIIDKKDLKIIENELGVNLVRLQAIQIYLQDREKRRE